MPRLSYVPRSRIHIPVDQYGRPFESKGAQERFERREQDPEYSRDCSKKEYAQAVEALRDYVSRHSAGDYTDAIEFVDGLFEGSAAVEDALSQLQFDILRVAEKNNPGWFEAEGRSYRRPGILRRHRGGVRRVSRYIGEFPPMTEDDIDDDPFVLPED